MGVKIIESDAILSHCMKDSLLLEVKKFLTSRFEPGKPLLLGYSGGPDSKALLYLLLECRRFFPLKLHLAHIDHGWRAESAGEVDLIQREADALKLPLHLQRLKGKDFTPGNLEDQGRCHRLHFFSQIYKEFSCQALLLGHHADDKAEVVLKRMFEGASLLALGGLALESFLHDMVLWRPLLLSTKAEILRWLFEKNLPFFQDPTNLSPQFLRGKMRQEMLPALAAMFGKEISSNLCRLGEESQEIKKYFSDLNRPILAILQEDKECVNLNPFLPMQELKLKYLLKEWMGGEGIVVSRQILEGITSALLHCTSRKKFVIKDMELCVEKGVLLILNRSSSFN